MFMLFLISWEFYELCITKYVINNQLKCMLMDFISDWYIMCSSQTAINPVNTILLLNYWECNTLFWAKHFIKNQLQYVLMNYWQCIIFNLITTRFSSPYLIINTSSPLVFLFVVRKSKTQQCMQRLIWCVRYKQPITLLIVFCYYVFENAKRYLELNVWLTFNYNICKLIVDNV